VLSTAGPVVKPVVSFVTTAVPGSSAVIQEVNAGLASLQGLVNGVVLPPLNGLLGGIIPNIL
jgi:hypothetical protein